VWEYGRNAVRKWRWFLAGLFVVVVAAGCGAAADALAPQREASSEEAAADEYTSESLGSDSEGALAASGQLALGTLLLAETENAVTPQQAEALLPLWQALQGGVSATVEVNAVLKQIEGTLTPEQLGAIAAMHLTQERMADWLRDQGIGFGGGPGGAQGELSEEDRATRRAQFGQGQGGEGQEIPPEMATRRAEFENMSDEEREALRATMRAGGGTFGGGEGRPGDATGPRGAGGFGGARQYMPLLTPLVEMLEELAAE
jgi:hypothetical protein